MMYRTQSLLLRTNDYIIRSTVCLLGTNDNIFIHLRKNLPELSTPLNVCLATTIHNPKQVKITHICWTF